MSFVVMTDNIGVGLGLDYEFSIEDPHEVALCPGSGRHAPRTAANLYPSGEESRIAIDHILVSPDIRVINAEVIVDRGGVSDHNPVIAELELTTET